MLSYLHLAMWIISPCVFHTESENPAITITALLASLNSCCNPWIYMFFSGHLLQDCIQSFPCCQNMKQTFNKEDSDSVSRRQTSYTNNRSPTDSMGTWKDSPKSSKSIKFIPVATWAPHSCSLTLGTDFQDCWLNPAWNHENKWTIYMT